jgi:hypothetical protein
MEKRPKKSCSCIKIDFKSKPIKNAKFPSDLKQNNASEIE